MNSGKSQELLRVWYSYTNGDITDTSVLVLTPEVDDRHGSGRVTTRAGQQILAQVISEDKPAKYYVDNYKEFGEIECVLIDEIQFLSKEDVRHLKDFTLKYDIPVIAFGLMKDFQNNIFEGSQAAIIYAEEISEVETICAKCRSKAIMNVKVDEHGNKITKGAQIQIGAEEAYISVCNKHWNELV